MKCTGLTRACLAPDLWHIPALCSLPATSPYRPLASSLCLSPPRSHSLPRSVSLTLSSPSLALSLSLSLLFCATLFLGSTHAHSITPRCIGLHTLQSSLSNTATPTRTHTHTHTHTQMYT